MDGDLRQSLEDVRSILIQYANILAKAAEVLPLIY